MQRKNGRHTPAFLLLFLNEAASNGAGLLASLERELPHCFSDSPGLYRALHSLEQEGAVLCSWDTSGTGPPRKIYTITAKGRSALSEFAEDIRRRNENFRFFLDRYREKP